MTNGHGAPPILLSIAGFDPSCGAGTAADLKTFAAHGCYGVAAITSLTVQNTQGVETVHNTPSAELRAQLEVLANDCEIAAVKIGMLGNRGNAAVVAEFLDAHNFAHVVHDPVMKSSGGTEPVAPWRQPLPRNLLRRALWSKRPRSPKPTSRKQSKRATRSAKAVCPSIISIASASSPPPAASTKCPSTACTPPPNPLRIENRAVDAGSRSSLWPFLALAVAVGIAALFVPRTPQPLSYHQFTDRRSWLGIPNFGDVVSNIPFLVAGFWGLGFLCRTSSRERFIDAGERWPYAFLFLGLLLTAGGSAYYPLAPDNARLVWGRLPMTLVFIPLV